MNEQARVQHHSQASVAKFLSFLNFEAIIVKISNKISKVQNGPLVKIVVKKFMLDNTRLTYVYLPLNLDSKTRSMYLFYVKKMVRKMRKYVTAILNNICILRK